MTSYRPHVPLSDREVGVLLMMAEGLGNDEIAQEMAISSETVKTHVRHVLEKLDARNRTHAVALGYHLSVLRPIGRAA